MVEITYGSKAPHSLRAEHPDFKKRSLDHTREAKIDGHRQRYGIEGICVRDGAGWIGLGPPGLCRSAKWVA